MLVSSRHGLTLSNSLRRAEDSRKPYKDRKGHGGICCAIVLAICGIRLVFSFRNLIAGRENRLAAFSALLWITVEGVLAGGFKVQVEAIAGFLRRGLVDYRR